MCGMDDHIFIIGGGEIYRQALLLADTIELTFIDAEKPEADTRFPDLSTDEWQIPAPECDRIDPKTSVRYAFLTVKRIMCDC